MLIVRRRYRLHEFINADAELTLRIFHLIKHCERGNGHVHVAVDLACEQARGGDVVYFVSGGGSYISTLEENGVIHLFLNQNATSTLKSLIKLFFLTLKYRPQIIHAHMMSSAVLGYIVSKITSSRLITTVHNSFNQHSGLMRLGERIVAVSWSEYNLLISRGYRRKKLVMIHNGPIGSMREKSKIADPVLHIPTPCIMTVSGLHRRKRVDLALRAFALAITDFPEWKLVVVGEGPDKHMLQALCKELSIDSSVYFVGSTTQSIRQLEKASIFVCLSEAEPFGLSVAEARAAGCAVIATNVGGMPEILGGGESGFLVPPGDVEGVASILIKFMSSQTFLETWRKAGLTGSDKFSVQKMTEKYKLVYQELLDSPRGRFKWTYK